MTVHKTLFERYYNTDEKPRISEDVTSSHWKEYSDKISVKKTTVNGNEHYDLIGYGFGENHASLLSKTFTTISELVNVNKLKIDGLRTDINRAKTLIKKMGLVYSQDAFRQVCTLNLLKRKMASCKAPERILIIGDGFGVLSALLHDIYPTAKIYLIDLGPTLFFQSYYLQKIFGENAQKLTDTQSGEEATFNFCTADNPDALKDREFELAINIASMQEMDMKIVSNYFSLLRHCKTKAFYCCNRMEKKMPGGEVSRFMDYPWKTTDVHLINELCPWHQWYLGYGSARSVKLGGVPVPFVHLYDGPHWHRFTLLTN